ncbi:MAG: hypothetical protein JJU11_10530 [Candidatus Sumerlaeia bacterium]|nr:hypothetical protein [Candidatus Sumerlaeia bacterium]
MRRRLVEVVILAEDRATATILRRYAERLGCKGRTRELICPGGSGEQFVRENYPLEVREQRRYIAGGIKNAALIVHVDADTDETSNERKRLGRKLASDGQAPRENSEKIAVIIPRRNMETWVHGLAGITVDEIYDYKTDPEKRLAENSTQLKKLHQERRRLAPDALYALTRRNAAGDLPEKLPSLKEAIPEFQRLED